DDRVRHAVERNAPPNHIRVATHPLLPEIFGHHRDVGALFFLRQKIAAANWTHAEHIEITRGDFAAEKLNRIAQAGQSEWNNVFAFEPVENFLGVAIMLKTGNRNRELKQIALARVRIHVDHALGLFEWQAAQKEIVDQAED